MQHGDLHGLNVLVDSRSEPVVIDYGDVKRASPALDPAALELSAVFHPDAQVARGGWPTEDTIARFRDLDAYLADCPHPNFVRVCRAWAERARASESEWLASVWAYAARQLKYENPTDPLARALTRAAGEALAE
jgi:aminoglycoside phosphotransferase (APT) family kinase protein